MILVAALLPLDVVASIAAAAIHEIVGHGFAALLVGGTFSGFILKLDGMGWAYAFAPPDAPAIHHIVVHAGGIVSTTAPGCVFLLLFFRLKSFYWRWAFLLIAWYCLSDGYYLFWNAYYPAPPGDVARILEVCREGKLADPSSMRWTFMIAGAIISLASTFACAALFFSSIEWFLTDGRGLWGLGRAVALLFFVALPGAAAWMLFDWNQLAEGIGWLPNIAGVVITIATAGFLHFVRIPAPRVYGSDAVTRRQIVIGWIGAALTVLLLASCFSDGVHWG